MGIVKVRAQNRITISKSIIKFLNMDDTKHVYIVVHDSETFFIKKQLNESDKKSFFIGPRSIHKYFSKKSFVSYCIVIPAALTREEILGIKTGDYVRVYVENEDIVVTTRFLKNPKKGE